MTRRNIAAACGFALFCFGCTNYTQVQMDLVTQARRGIAVTAQSQQNHSLASAELARMRRQRLDDAFDADVVDRGADLDADWVIEARKAYAAVLDAYAKERAATTQAEAAARRNLRDIDEALARVQSLQSAQLKLSKPVEDLLLGSIEPREQP